MRKAILIGAAILSLAALVLAQQLSTDDFNSLQRWNANLRSHRPAGKILGAQAAASSVDDDAYIGVTLWKLRPSNVNDDPAVRIRSQEDGAASEWTPERASFGTPQFEGDRYQITIETARPGYLYILENDDHSSVTRPRLIFPTLRARFGSNRVSAGSAIRIPYGGNVLPYFDFRSNPAGRASKTFKVVISSKPIDDLQPESGSALTPEQAATLENPSQSAKPLSFFTNAHTAAPEEVELLKRGSGLLTQDGPSPDTVYHTDTSLGTLLIADVSVQIVPVPKPDTCPACPRPLPLILMPTQDRPRVVTASAFLTPVESEETGYGLYSYILFGSRPRSLDSDEWRRYQQTIMAFLGMPASRELLQYAPLGSINTTFLPVTCHWQELPNALSELFRFSPEQVAIHRLEHQAAAKGLQDEIRWQLQVQGHAQEIACILVGNYDYARAQVLLSHFASPHMDGPYIISATQPLSSVITPPNHYLYQDLSSVPPEMVPLWIKQFMVQAQEPDFWKVRTKDQFVLRLRTAIAVAGHQLPDLSQAIRWQFASLALQQR